MCEAVGHRSSRSSASPSARCGWAAWPSAVTAALTPAEVERLRSLIEWRAECGWSRSAAPTSVAENDADAILAGHRRADARDPARNALAAEDLVSCIFTLTPDLDAEFPAVAARRDGARRRAAAVRPRDPGPGRAARSIIRVLIHAYGDGRPRPQHVYLGEAAKLRLDLTGAQ